MVIVGIDPSINSTGICVDKNGKTKYYIITPHMTKKMIKFAETSKDVNYLPYEKHETKGLDYSDKEFCKTDNIYRICTLIKYIIKKYRPDLVIMEGVSYGSTGSAALVDLSGLQFAIRMTLVDNKTQFKIVSPTSLKKYAVANGTAEKAIMIDAWKRMDTKMAKIDEVKIDDLADAYFLAHYENEA